MQRERERTQNTFIGCLKEIHSIRKKVKSKKIGKAVIHMKCMKINDQYMKMFFSYTGAILYKRKTLYAEKNILYWLEMEPVCLCYSSVLYELPTWN